MTGPNLNFKLPQSGPFSFLPPKDSFAPNVSFATQQHQVELTAEPSKKNRNPDTVTAWFRMAERAWFGADSQPLALSDSAMKNQLHAETVALEQLLNIQLTQPLFVHAGAAPRLDPLQNLLHDERAPLRASFPSLNGWRRAHTEWLQTTISTAEAPLDGQVSDEKLLQARLTSLVGRIDRPAAMHLNLRFDLNSNIVNLRLTVPAALAQTGLVYRAHEDTLEIDNTAPTKLLPTNMLRQIAVSQLFAITRAVHACMMYYAPTINAQVLVETADKSVDLMSLHVAPAAWGLDMAFMAGRTAPELLDITTKAIQCRPAPDFALNQLHADR